MADGDPAAGGILIADPEPASDPPATPDNQSTQGDPGGPTEGPPVSDDSKPGTGWRKQLAEDLQSEERLGKFDGEKAFDKLARSYLDAETRLNEPLKRPADDAPEEEKSRYFAQIGRPESPDNYDFGQVQLPEGVKIGEDTDKFARDVAFKLGLSSDQANELVGVVAARDAGRIAITRRINTDTLKKGLDVLQQEWGDGFEARRQAAHNKIEQLNGGKAVIAMLGRSGMENHSDILRLFDQVATMTAEAPSVRGDGHPAGEYDNEPFPLAAKISAENKTRKRW